MPFDRFTYWKEYREKNAGKYSLKRSSLKKKQVKPIRKVSKGSGGVKSLGQLIKEAVTVFHKWIRERDSQGNYFCCISCGLSKEIDQMQAGHYLPAGNNGVIRLNEWNVNGQCIECNINKHGNQEGYKIGLTAKIGFANVQILEQQAKVPFKWDRDELTRIIETYKEKLRKAS